VSDERTDFDRLSAGILSGRGVVARYPGVVCVADAAAAEPVRALVALCAAVAGFEPGRPLARRLAAWLSGPDAPPSSLRFGTLADAGDRWAVFLSGAVSLHDAGIDTTIPGADAAAWTDRLVPPGGPLVLLLDGSEGAVNRAVDGAADRVGGRVDDPFADLHDLRAGTVPGRGVVLATASAARHTAIPPLPAPASPAAPSAPSAAPSAVAPFAPPAVAPDPALAAPSAVSPLASPAGPPAVAPAAASAAPPRPGDAATPSPIEAPGAQPPGVEFAKAPAAPPPVRPADPIAGRSVPDEEETELTVSDGSGPPPIPPTPRAGEPALRPPRRADRIDRAPAPAARPPLTPGRPLSPARRGRPADPGPDAPVPTEPAARRQIDDSPVVEGPRTRGHLCSRGHLNDPRSHFCVLCGIRMNERTGELVFGPRPPLGLLVFDDGATYSVDAEYLVGRMPDVDERVRNGSLRSIVVEDRSGAVSRVHAEVRVDGWDVMLVDSRSRNGTHIAGPGATAWTPVPAGRSHRLTPGTRVRLGSRTFLFESPSGVR
jgi:FHA domain